MRIALHPGYNWRRKNTVMTKVAILPEPSAEGLMQLWRTARDTGKAFSPSEQAELNALVDAEVQASGERAAAVLADLEK